MRSVKFIVANKLVLDFDLPDDHFIISTEDKLVAKDYASNIIDKNRKFVIMNRIHTKQNSYHWSVGMIEVEISYAFEYLDSNKSRSVVYKYMSLHTYDKRTYQNIVICWSRFESMHAAVKSNLNPQLYHDIFN